MLTDGCGTTLALTPFTFGLAAKLNAMDRAGEEMEVPTVKEKTNDSPDKVATGAIKYDAGKPAIYRGLVDYFPRAIEAVADISTFGASKYAWKGWEGVDDGVNRYSDAMVRHLIAEGKGTPIDADSGRLHAAHVAWGALARLELMLREQNESNNR